MAMFALTNLARSKRSLQQLCQAAAAPHTHNRQHSLLLHQLILPPFEHIQRHHTKLKPSSSTTSPRNIHTRKLKSNCDARPWLCVNKVPPTMGLAKIKEGINKIDPVVGMENWEIRIEGLHRKFKRSYPTQLVLFKVQNDLVARNISD